MPVSKLGRSRTSKGKTCPCSFLGGSISRLRRLPGMDILTRGVPGTTVTRILFLALIFPRLTTLPAIKPKSPSGTSKLAALTIVPTASDSKIKLSGLPFKLE